ncbi:MAG: hypothetical protein V8R07_03560 [Bacteroides fragilis]
MNSGRGSGHVCCWMAVRPVYMGSVMVRHCSLFIDVHCVNSHPSMSILGVMAGVR